MQAFSQLPLGDYGPSIFEKILYFILTLLISFILTKFIIDNTNQGTVEENEVTLVNEQLEAQFICFMIR